MMQTKALKIRKKTRRQNWTQRRRRQLQRRYVRDATARWLDLSGECVLSLGSAFRVPVTLSISSPDSRLKVAADGEVLQSAFYRGKFDHRKVKLKFGNIVCRTSVISLTQTPGELVLDGTPFFRASARSDAAKSRPRRRRSSPRRETPRRRG